jgi:hypothetical protein
VGGAGGGAPLTLPALSPVSSRDRASSACRLFFQTSLQVSKQLDDHQDQLDFSTNSQKRKLTIFGNTKQAVQDYYDTVFDNSIPFRKNDLPRVNGETVFSGETAFSVIEAAQQGQRA